LSNKLKVIALFLSVSLLSGCNGTTGSGNQETTMQGNGQPANTTTVPTAKPENPTPATGDAVRVARWSKDPRSASFLAPLGGTLAIANNCLVMSNKDAPPTLLILPYSSGAWNDAKRTFTTHDGKVIAIGKPIKVVGGTIPNLDFLKGFAKYDVPDCGMSWLFLVDSID
jgi:hypothetical protein